MNTGDIKTLSYMSYIGPLVLVGLFSDARKNDPPLRFHLNQGLVLAIGEALCLIVHGILDRLLGWIPIISLIPSVLLIFITLGSIALSLYGIYNVAADKLNTLPVIGSVNILK